MGGSDANHTGAAPAGYPAGQFVKGDKVKLTRMADAETSEFAWHILNGMAAEILEFKAGKFRVKIEYNHCGKLASGDHSKKQLFDHLSDKDFVLSVEPHQVQARGIAWDAVVVAKSASKPLEVVFLVDITGSMSDELEGVKATLVKYIKEHAVHAGNTIRLHVMVYAENGYNVYCDHFSTLDNDLDKLLEYVKKINLCCPPSANGKSANGGDGEENVWMALASLFKGATSTSKNRPDGPVRIPLDSEVLCFLITDAPPHNLGQCTAEADAERKWLLANGYAPAATQGFRNHQNHEDFDGYRVLDRILEQRNGKMIIVPVLCREMKHFQSEPFFQMASLTGGAVLSRKDRRDVDDMAAGLAALVNLFALVRATQSLDDVDTTDLPGFKAYDINQFEQQDQEGAPREERFKMTFLGQEAMGGAIMGLCSSTLKVGGRKYTKRTKKADARVIEGSVKLAGAAVKKLLGHDEDGSELRAAAEELKDIMDAPDVPFLMKTVNEFADKKFKPTEQNDHDDNADAPTCILTMETIKEVCESYPGDDADPEDQMKWVMQLILARLVQIEFPKDRDGKPDFLDSWSASVRGVGPTIMSSEGALKMRLDDPDDVSVWSEDSDYHMSMQDSKKLGNFQDPQDRKTYSAVLLLAHPNDPFGKAMFRIISCTPIPDWLSTYFMSGQLCLCRNLSPGITSSTMMSLIGATAKRMVREQNYVVSEQHWEIMRSCATTLRMSSRPIARDVLKSLEDQKHFNPSDSVGKLFGAVGSLGQSEEDLGHDVILRLFREFVSDDIMYFNRNRDGRSSTFCLAPEVFIDMPGKDLDPLDEQHPVEVENFTIKSDWCEKVIPLLKGHPFYELTRVKFQIFLALINTKDLANPIPPTFFDYFMDDESYAKLFLESMLLEKRSARYTLVGKNSERGKAHGVKIADHQVFVPLTDDEYPSLEDLLRDYLRDHFKEVVAEYRKDRHEAMREEMLFQAASLELSSEEQLEDDLSSIRRELFDVSYKLDRMDVPAVLSKLPTQGIQENPMLAKVLVKGSKWTTVPAAAVNQGVHNFILQFFEGQLRQDIGVALRARACVVNRTGHSVKLSASAYSGSGRICPDKSNKRYKRCVKKRLWWSFRYDPPAPTGIEVVPHCNRYWARLFFDNPNL